MRAISKHIILITSALLVAGVFSLFALQRSVRSADEMIILPNENKVEYKGNARFFDRDSGTLILSDYMQYDKNRGGGFCKGNVRVYNKDKSMLIRAGKLDYDDNAQKVRALIRPVLYAKNENLTIRSVIMERDLNTQRTRAIQNVEIEKIHDEDGERTYGFAGELEYVSGEDVAYLKQNPRLIHKGNILLGEIIQYETRSDTVNVYGEGRIYLENREGEAYTKGDMILSNYISADRIHFINNTTEQNAEAFGTVKIVFPEKNLIAEGGYGFFDIQNESTFLKESPVCRLVDSETIIESKLMRYNFGGEKEEAFFYTNVLIIANQDKTIIEAGEVFVNLKDGYSKLTKEPVCYLENGRIRITAHYFERFEDKKKLYAKGDVVITGRDINAQSTLAVYDALRKRIKLWGGAPRIIQGGKEMFAKEILIYPETERFVLTDAEGPIE